MDLCNTATTIYVAKQKIIVWQRIGVGLRKSTELHQNIERGQFLQEFEQESWKLGMMTSCSHSEVKAMPQLHDYQCNAVIVSLLSSHLLQRNKFYLYLDGGMLIEYYSYPLKDQDFNLCRICIGGRLRCEKRRMIIQANGESVHRVSQDQQTDQRMEARIKVNGLRSVFRAHEQ